MATTTSHKLTCVFKDADGEKITQNFNYANPSATANQVKSYMNAAISQGADIFNKVPAHRVEAYMTATTKTDIDVSD